MTFEPAALNLVDSRKGYLHFVLYTEPRLGLATSSLNAALDVEASYTATPHFQEWRSRLVRCRPNAMHCSLVEPGSIPGLFRPCVTEDKDNPAAISRSGCACRQTYYDPVFGLPVVAEHCRYAGAGGTDQWGYLTYAPLALRPDDVFSSFITSSGLFWARTDEGVLSFLPQKNANGYNMGYSGGGPHALAAYLTQVARSDGRATAAGASRKDVDPAILAWMESSAAERGRNELSLSDLQAMLES